MNFYNSTVANFIQIVSLGLEFVGLNLVIIEVWFPAFADRIENYIDKAENRLIDFGWSIIFRANKPDLKGPQSRLVRIFFQIISIPAALLAILTFWILADGLYKNQFKDSVERPFQVLPEFLIPFSEFTGLGLFFILLVVSIFLVFVAIVPPFINFCNRITKGRALGAIGVALAVIGFGGEIYQIFTLSEEEGISKVLMNFIELLFS